MIMKPRQIVLALSAALLLSATAMPASAKPGKWTAPSLQGHAHKVDQNYVIRNRAISSRTPSMQNRGSLFAQNGISRAEAKSIARQHVKGGEVVDVVPKGKTYRVRVIAKDGRVLDVLIDANTGRVQKVIGAVKR